jgi:predicted nucleotidyltransferase
VFEELASILRRTSGVADVLAAALAPARDQIRAAFVYGSVAQGRERAGSDVDLIVIGELGFGEAVNLLHPAQETLGREISPRVYGVKEWKQKRRSPDAFLREVLAKPKIFVMGSERELG